MPRLRRTPRPRPSREATRRPLAAEVLEERTLLTAYLVDSLADTVAADGRLTLREAILAANANAAVNEAAAGQGGGVTDTISFAASVAGGRIATVSELVIGDRLAVFGPVVVSGELAHRVFRIEAGAAVSMYGLTVQAGGGRYVSGDRTPEGGGIFNAGALVLSQCLLLGNEAAFYGGGVFNAEAGSLTVAGCGFRGNGTLYRGGAIYSVGLLAVSDSAFTDNYGTGGGVYNVGTATIVRSVSRGDGGLFNAGAMTIEGGTVTEGGGVGNTGTMTLTGVNVSKNLTGGVTNDGGMLRVSGGLISENAGTGLSNSGGIAGVYGCVIYGNGEPAPSGAAGWINRGGGVYNGGNDRGAGTLTLRDCVISQNAGRAGGGVYNWRAGVLTVSNCLITGNAASFDSPYAGTGDNRGGGIWNIGTLTVLGSVVSDNAAADYGGGIYNARVDRVDLPPGAGVVTVADTSVSGNRSGNRGGGVYNAASFRAERTAIADNTAYRGGGVYSGGGASVDPSLGLTDCLVTGNLLAGPTNGDFRGGGVYGEGRLTLLRGRVSGNGGDGVYNTGTALVRGTQVSGNFVSVSGNASGLVNEGLLEVYEATVVSNQAAGIRNLGVLGVVDGVVAGNGQEGVSAGGGTTHLLRATVANNRGTGVLISGGTISDGTISGNADGGVMSYGPLAMANSTVSGNYSRGPGGGLALNGPATLRNVTVFGNRGNADGLVGFGAGVYVTSADVALHNTIVAGNVSGPRGTAGTPFEVTGAFVSGTHNLIGDAATAGGLTDGADGNVVGVNWRTVLDPALKDNGGPTRTHRLLPRGRAVDAGSDAQAVGVNGPLAADQRGVGFPRVVGAAVDIGAFEFGAGATTSAYAALAAFWGRAGEDEAFAGLLAGA